VQNKRRASGRHHLGPEHLAIERRCMNQRHLFAIVTRQDGGMQTSGPIVEWQILL
jgi:hypothetical protein